MTVRNYRDLLVWQKAMDLAMEVYRVSGEFPRTETYGLRAQLRRAAVSIPSNIAEGQGRKSTKDYLRHLSIALGSLCEMETQILIAGKLEYVNAPALNHLLEASAEVGRFLNCLANSLTRKLAPLPT